MKQKYNPLYRKIRVKKQLKKKAKLEKNKEATALPEDKKKNKEATALPEDKKRNKEATALPEDKKKQETELPVDEKKQKEIAHMSVDDMFSMIQEDDAALAGDTPSRGKKKRKKKTNSDSSVGNADPENAGSDDEEDELVDAPKLTQKEYLEKLKTTDPEFYSAMMQSSDLMDLRSSDEEDEGEEDEDKYEDVKKPCQEDSSQAPEEEDSDYSDTETANEEGLGGNITPEMIADWEVALRSDNPMEALKEVQQAFLAAVESLSGGKKQTSVDKKSKYDVKGSQNFNAVIRLCLKNVVFALRTIFKIKDSNQLPAQTKRWSRNSACMKLYLREMVALTEVVADPSVAETVMRHGVLPLIPFYAGHLNFSKLLARRLITMWATSEKKVRVYAFLAIFRLTQILKGNFLEWMLKKMYISYVSNCRFTSPSTWSVIDFMRVSLVELYTLDFSFAYNHAFVYIRQMAIHLRNATIYPKKEHVQLVYNWQYIHCLNLWCDLLAKTHPNAMLQPMIFPVVQVAIGTMKLQPTQTFFPLAFHICRMLTDLSRKTGTFIPVLPFLLEILDKAIFFKKPKKTSVKPFNWMCILRLSRGELKESAFKDGVIDQVYEGMVNYLSVVSSSIGFPDFVVPTVLHLKSFLKKCKSSNYCKRFKHLLDKIRENSDFIEDRRKDVKFGITDREAVKNWEVSVKQSSTPLYKYYESYRKVVEKQAQQLMADSVSVPDYDLPSMKKRKLEGKGDTSEEEDEDDLELGPEDQGEDSEEDKHFDDNDTKVPPNKKTKFEDAGEILADLGVSDNNKKDIIKEFNFSDDDE